MIATLVLAMYVQSVLWHIVKKSINNAHCHGVISMIFQDRANLKRDVKIDSAGSYYTEGSLLAEPELPDCRVNLPNPASGQSQYGHFVSIPSQSGSGHASLQSQLE